MLNKLLWILGPLAVIYYITLSVSSHNDKSNLTTEFVEATHDICLPVLNLGLPVDHSRFQKKISQIIPSSFTIEEGKVSGLKENICAQFRLEKSNSPLGISICQNPDKELQCRISASIHMGLQEDKYVRSVREFSQWPSIYPNRELKRKGLPQGITRRVLCRRNTEPKNVNSVEIGQRGGFHLVRVTLKQQACE